MIVLGIDPGLFGAVAVLTETGHVIGVHDTPIVQLKINGRMRHDYMASDMAQLIRRAAHWQATDPCCAALEHVNAMPDQGVTSMFTMGRGLGLWQGILAALGVPYVLVRPQRWKALLLDGMDRSSKEASRLRAQQLFPGADLSLKKHHGRADALLLAEYLRRTRSAPPAP